MSYTATLEYFKEKYGEEEGLKKYLDINERKGKTLKNFIRLYGEEEGLRRYIKFHENKKDFYSGIASNLFEELDKILNLKEKSYYAPKTKEFGKIDKTLQQYFFYDYVIPEIKFCIEFNGDVFHAHPDLFESTDYPNPFEKDLTAQKIWEKDRIKKECLINEGFDIIIIWECDYRKNKSKIIKNLVEEIKRRLRKE
jgi:G:T-mismatch repair DNA endonuclease (very short patch repair protein)